MWTKEQIKNELIKQLSIDYNCKAEDFYSNENIITVAVKNEGRREYSENAPFFSMVTLGQTVIISANEQLHKFLTEFVKDKIGFWLFGENILFEIQSELSKYGKTLSQTHHMFLPDTKAPNIKPDFKIKWFEEKDIGQFYGDKRFTNAFCEEYKPNRPDLLGVCALINGEIAGMAGCSADSKLMWQIGIDVMPQYRGKGIGTALVGLLKDEIFKRGAIPFYGTASGNIHSRNIAVNCGFYPAWIEINNK